MHTGGGERGRRLAPHLPPSNHIEKFGLKNAIKNKDRGTPLPPHRFSQISKYPLQKNLKMTVHFYFNFLFTFPTFNLNKLSMKVLTVKTSQDCD